MALYTKDSIERVKEAVDMVELVGSRTDLRRVGARWVGLCPFHEERTPSFSVSAEHKVYYCFGCEASGDAIGFVREAEALDFREAVELLAERYGVRLELEHEDPRAEDRRRQRERLLALLERSARFYAAYLWEAEEGRGARDYLAGRGLSEQVLRDFGIGFSPAAWDRLVTRAASEGFTDAELLAAGLGQRSKQGGLIDRFRGRIMFPLTDHRGRVLGFGARALLESERPKYLNTSESELYHKGRQLFGLDRARAAAAKAGRVVVVEGYTDVLALHQAGVREAVAIMGTALTKEQLAELGRTAPAVCLALDPDRSGQAAMSRAAREAQARDLDLTVVELPAGRDPAELVASEGAEGFAGRLGSAVPALEFEVRRVLADADLGSPAGRDRALEEARPLIAETSEKSAVRDHLVRLVSDRLDVPPSYVTTPSSRGRARSAPAGRVAAPVDESLRAERAFLTMCLRSGAAGREYLDRLEDHHLSFEATRRARDHLRTHFDEPLADLPEEDPDARALILSAAMADDPPPASEPGLRVSLLALEDRRLERELRRAAQEGNLGRQDELAGARQEIRREMDAVMGQTA